MGLDPEVASYNILDVALAKLPQAERYLSETRVHVAALNDDGEYDPAEGFRLTTLIAVVGNERLAAARKQIKLAADAAQDRPEIARSLTEAGKTWGQGTEAWIDELTREMRTGHPRPATTQALFDSSASLTQSLDSMEGVLQQAADDALRIRHTHQLRTRRSHWSAARLQWPWPRY